MGESWPTGGIVSFAELERLGIARHERRRLLATGRLRRITRGWYATADARRDAERAVVLGGRLTCVSALAVYGVWLVPFDGLHVRLRDGAATPPGDVIAHRAAGQPLGNAALDDPEASFERSLRCLTPRDALVVGESMARAGAMGTAAIEHLAAAAPRAVRAAYRHFSRSSQSGTETIVRFELQRRGIRVVPQACIGGVGFVDLLVGDRLIIECDSVAYHTSISQYRADRRRDLEAHRRGYLTVRLSYEQIMYDWDETWRVLASLIARGDHHWPAREA